MSSLNDTAENKGWGTFLVRWYRDGHRDLPWRRTKDPYAVWVSEIMLQQTRVETVRDYYRRFLARFPDAHSLAEAPEADVLKLWEGLGYYSRARNLQKAARVVDRELSGAFPCDAQSLRGLPGIGPYTAAAVASIVFGEAVPAIDGNVKRVGSRVLGIRLPIDAPEAKRLLENSLREAILGCDPGDFNQAMMELGAILCLPKNPGCAACPLAGLCDANREGDAESLPVHERKIPGKRVDVAVCLLSFQDGVLVYRREERLLHGLYVFRLLEEVTDPQTAADLLREDGLSAVFSGSMGEAKHVFTHRIWQMRLYHFRLTESPSAEWLASRGAVFANRATLDALPIPTAMKAAKRAAQNLLQTADENGPEPTREKAPAAGAKPDRPSP